MKVLWVNNILAEYPAKSIGINASPMGGWLMSMAYSIVNISEIEMAIVAPGPVKSLVKLNDNSFTYFIVPNKLSSKEYEKIWEKIIEMYHPSIIHINGTEMKFSQTLFNISTGIKTVISIQGLVSECSKYYRANLSARSIWRFISIKDILRRSTIFDQQNRMKKNGVGEIMMLKKADIIIGRTDWDYAACLKNNVASKYQCINENLRDVFYNNTWKVSTCKKHTIFCSQGAIPYKGIHVVLEALSVIKTQFPDTRLIVAGYDLLKNDTFFLKIKSSGYARYLRSLIIKYDLKENVEFTGPLQEKEMCEQYLDANVIVQSSFIENSPNSLGEAILLKAPIIASFVGGTGKYVSHEYSAFLYPPGDSNLLAYYVIKVFNDDKLAEKIGNNAYESSSKFYDRKLNAQTTLNLYHSLIK